MNQDERLIKITEYLNEHKTMSLKMMCELFYVSRDTARRDIVKLTNETAMVRTHGGVAIPSFHHKISDYLNREGKEAEYKEGIGQKAASLVKDNEIIYLDVSTTVNCMASFLEANNVTVVTNSIDTVNRLASTTNVNIHILGGQLNKQSRHVTGFAAMEKLKDYHFDKVFIGAPGLTEDGVYYAFEEDIYFKRELVKQTNEVFLLIDATKFNQRQNFKALQLEAIDTIITNDSVPDCLGGVVKNYGIEVMLGE
ncbi:DeoR/GlpR family DNA-binding transcription regulator [Bacillus gaemokensis]|uniref:DeoR faimly transcriptional regulator n=1 Tax=Bacillus gaemokensis TaxID=574375 RepID=A0A073KQB7_9BACI|nr:DeoR/GlpR family DNA-binding transcription regulator [Bacillus gaemokensis]KEK24583.1 DeoR faimly transcriptional regulator [Bacillus gaemokensis]KYG39471.1 DeoR family transcriptional regulator [Bacillus gaemokensis]